MGIWTVALTGGIGSGKNVAAAAFASLGVPIFDTDVIAHQLVAPGMPLLQTILDHYGPGFALENGGLDRKKLADYVFAHPAERQWLESQLHPAIRKTLYSQLEKCTAPYAIAVIPLFFESKHPWTVQRVLVIDCPVALQIARTLQRDHRSLEAIQHILDSQVTRAERQAGADDLICNDGPPEVLIDAVHHLHQRYLQLAAR